MHSLDNYRAFATLSFMGVGYQQIWAAWGQAFANPGATPELLAHTCIRIQTYSLSMEDFTGNTSRFKDWLIGQGQEKRLEGF